MIPIGDRPILWHIMRYYSSFGTTSSSSAWATGPKSSRSTSSTTRRLSPTTSSWPTADAGSNCSPPTSRDWSITFVNTGLRTSIGQRLKAVQEYIGTDELFLTNYGDTLTDASIPDMVEMLTATDKTALFIAARPTYNFHVAQLAETTR